MENSWAPGEREELVLRPHPLAWTPYYLAAASFAVLAALMAWWFRSTAWNQVPATDLQRFWSFLYGNGVAAGVYTIGALLVIGITVAWLRGRPLLVLPFAVAGVTAVALTASMAPQRYATSLPALVAPWSILALAWVEVARQNHTYTFTNLRIRHAAGIPQRKRATVTYQTIADLDLVRPPLGRWLRIAHITPIPLRGDPVMTLWGMRPAHKVRHLITALVERFEQTPYAEGDSGGQQRLEQAIAAIRHKGDARPGTGHKDRRQPHTPHRR